MSKLTPKGRRVLRDLSETAASHLDDIRSFFKPGVKLTLLVRTVSHPDGSRDFVLMDDLIDEAVAALLRRKHDANGITGQVGEGKAIFADAASASAEGR